MKLERIWSLVSGILLISLGIMYFTSPVFGLTSIVYMLTFVFFARGLSSLVTFAKSGPNRSPFLLMSGLFDVIIGIIFILDVALIADLISYFLAFWALFTGVIECVKAFDMKKNNFKGWIWTLLMGGFSIIIGFILIKNVLIAPVLILYITSLLFIVLGSLNIISFFTNSKS